MENERFLSDAERIEALAQRRIREKLGSSNGSGKDVIKLKGHQGDIRSVKFFQVAKVSFEVGIQHLDGPASNESTSHRFQQSSYRPLQTRLLVSSLL